LNGKLLQYSQFASIYGCKVARQFDINEPVR